jgi:hypothetical protein
MFRYLRWESHFKGITLRKRSSSDLKVQTLKLLTRVQFLPVTRLYSQIELFILEELDALPLTWTVICCGGGIKYSRHTRMACVSRALAKKANSWQLTNTIGMYYYLRV